MANGFSGSISFDGLVNGYTQSERKRAYWVVCQIDGFNDSPVHSRHRDCFTEDAWGFSVHQSYFGQFASSKSLLS